MNHITLTIWLLDGREIELRRIEITPDVDLGTILDSVLILYPTVTSLVIMLD